MTFLVYWTSKDGAIDLDDVGTFKTKAQAENYIEKERQSKEVLNQAENVEIIETSY
jgi:hypothetical protein